MRTSRRRRGSTTQLQRASASPIFDANRDGWPDIAISNDTQPNKLYINNRNGTFTEKGVPAGIGFSEDGVARAGMGIDAADFDRSGYPSLVITNFSNQMMALYHNEKNGLFVDEAPQTAMGRDSLLTLGFGCFFFDYDLDGWLDMYVVDGHIDPQIERVAQRVHYAEPPHLFRNLDGHRFEDVASAMGKSFDEPRVGRGAAYGDINNDGAPDIVITTNGGPAALFLNRGVTNHGLRIKLVGTKSNRDGIGAEVTVTAADGQGNPNAVERIQLPFFERIGSYLWLGAHGKADGIEIRWPSGKPNTSQMWRRTRSSRSKKARALLLPNRSRNANVPFNGTGALACATQKRGTIVRKGGNFARVFACVRVRRFRCSRLRGGMKRSHSDPLPPLLNDLHLPFLDKNE